MPYRIEEYLYPESPQVHLERREPGSVGSNPGAGAIRVWEDLPYAGPWTSNAYLGAGVALTQVNQNTAAVENIGTPAQVLKLPEWGPPVRWTINLGIDGLDANNIIAMRLQLAAIISIGCGGMTQSFEVDWLNGTSFSVTANSIDIKVIHDIAPTVPLPVTLRATAMLARGASQGMPVRTTSSTVAGTAYSPYIRIPAFARRIKIIPQAVAAGDNAVLYQVDSRVEQWKVQNLTIATCQELELIMNSVGFPIAPGATFARIYNGSATAFAFGMQFELQV